MTHSADKDAGVTCPSCGWHTANPEWEQHACPGGPAPVKSTKLECSCYGGPHGGYTCEGCS